MSRGKPVTEIGTWGQISVRQVRPGAHRARARIRDQDGTTRQVTATGTTRAAAERALRKKLAERTVPTQLALTGETSLRELADFWLERLRTEERVESSTINEYRRILDKVVLPEIGGLRLRELSTSRLEHFLIGVRQTSINRQRKAKVVLGAMLGLAVRHDALPINPVQQTSRVHRARTATRSLTAGDLAAVRTAVRAWEDKQRPGPKSQGMGDIVDLMLATGARIGEILALRWSDISLDSTPPTLTISGTIKTDPGKGTYRKGSPKSDAGYRTLVLPDFAAALLRRRQRDSGGAADEPVFPTRNGTWQQVTNVERGWREIRQGTELEWVTPHTFRKTVATLIAERVGAEIAAQQLGHSSPEITREFYIAKPAIAADVAHVLSELADVGRG